MFAAAETNTSCYCRIALPSISVSSGHPELELELIYNRDRSHASGRSVKRTNRIGRGRVRMTELIATLCPSYPVCTRVCIFVDHDRMPQRSCARDSANPGAGRPGHCGRYITDTTR